MSESVSNSNSVSTPILLQTVIIQRNAQPTGKRILADGLLQRVSDDAALNPRPGPDDLLEKDRPVAWEDVRTLSTEELQTVHAAIQDSGFFDLPPRILINYCKEDPGVQIWTVDAAGERMRVVLYDPKPKRSPEIDKLSVALAPIFAG